MKSAHSILFISSLLLASGRPFPQTDGAGGDSTSLNVKMDGSSGATPSTSTAPSSGTSTRPQTLAIDTESGAVVAYDKNGKNLGEFNSTDVATGGTVVNVAKRDTTNTSIVNTCRPATQSEITSIPGWSKFVAGVTAWAGNQAPQTYYVNDTDPAWGATVCYSTDTVQLTVQGNPTCTSNSVNVGGTSNGTNATFSTTVSKGTTTTFTTTTEKTSSFNWSDQMSITANLGVVKASDQQTLSLSLTNTQGTQNSKSSGEMTSEKASWSNPSGETCSAVTNVTVCDYTATGSLDVYLSGYIWLSFKTYFRDPSCVASLIQPGAPCAGKGSKHNDLNHCYDANQCPEHGHYGQQIETYLPSISDRSNPLQFSDAVSSTTNAQYQIECH
ncbi:hypothetical protein DFH07DRAFT_964316 [Mycena maculata]|uniref:Uncharacterized protein n=1 Tax=Mycena maculata TaxID=230809 RepID=A0AAD7IIZ4_9AGAR|nr:hypothetical protein DFH07DRAFT_964316 [Mycena maculata]